MGEMHELSDAQLLREYAKRGNGAAFREIVMRYTDLLYSAALRQVKSGDVAADITQSVFVDLARKAQPVSDRLSVQSSLAGWLHRSTRYAALNHLRDTRRRNTNERQAMEQLLSNSESALDWERIRPALDEALDSLGDEEREALLLRYFKDQDFRAVGLALGVSDDAAQKRVSRAVERLREFFAQRGVTIGAGGLVVVISANAVQAAPVGLAVTISTAAMLAGTTLATTATATATKIIAMTTLQKTLVGATVALLAGAGIYEVRQAAQQRDQVQTLQQQQAPLAKQAEQLRQERDEATNRLALLTGENERLNRNSGELLRLRGEVSLLRRTQNTSAKSAGSTASSIAITSGQEQAEVNIGRELGLAVVQGDPSALDKLTEFSKTAHRSYNTNSIGLDDTKRGELASRTFAPLQKAFDVIGEAAVNGNQVAVEAVNRGLQIPELQGHSVQIVGTLAGKGNESALEMLLNPDKYGILLSGSVFALRPAAEAGNQRAIDALANVTKDARNQPLWFEAANILATAAESGNAVAVDALVAMSASTNQNVRSAVLIGLKKAAANQNIKAAETLRSIGVQ